MASGAPTSVVTLDAVREQLRLMGHQVPDEVIEAFLDEAGFSAGSSRSQQPAREQQPYKASFDFVQTQAAGRPRTPSPRRDTAPSRSSRRSLQTKMASRAQVAAADCGKDELANRFNEDDSPTGQSCSSCVSEYEMQAAAAVLEEHNRARIPHQSGRPAGSREPKQHQAATHSEAEEDGASSASSLQSYRLARAAERRAKQKPNNSRATQATAFSPDGSFMELSLQGSHRDADRCSEKCSCCMGNDDQGTSMHSTQTTPSLDGDSTPGLRSRSRSAGTLPRPAVRRVLRLPPTSLVPPLNVAMRRPITDRVARYREMQQTWESDPFLKSGGDASSQRRPRQGFREAFQSLHLLEAAARTHMPATARMSSR